LQEAGVVEAELLERAFVPFGPIPLRRGSGFGLFFPLPGIRELPSEDIHEAARVAVTGRDAGHVPWCPLFRASLPCAVLWLSEDGGSSENAIWVSLPCLTVWDFEMPV
jgi:hypothetical protein